MLDKQLKKDYGFNPTLVRLRPPGSCQARAGSIEFQSHAGSIEAGGSREDPPAFIFVSIPRWFD